MEVIHLEKKDFLSQLRRIESSCLDFAIITSSFLPVTGFVMTQECLKECIRILKDDGLLFVHGQPEHLPALVQGLMKPLVFKYWIAIESNVIADREGLPTAHSAVILFAKNRHKFRINKIRFPHRYCASCNHTLKDWGGKSHLMHPDGYAISDVWRDLPQEDNYKQLSSQVLGTLLKLIDDRDRKAKGIIGPLFRISRNQNSTHRTMSKNRGLALAASLLNNEVNKINDDWLDIVHHGDACEILRQYPDNSVDLVFADPPYNLDKSYNSYDDEKGSEEYLKWCNSWLSEYVRVLKPTGSLYLLTLPKWAVHHAVFLDQYLYFQNWVVWDAVSEPRGKIMPAHYALLFYTKHPVDFTFNYDVVSPIDAPGFCLRASCIRERIRQGVNPKVPLTDIWSDIHRIKHKRDRDPHPCQLPEKLMERIVLLSSNPGGIVLDALCGVGTTPLVALKLGRRYIAVDIDKRYVEITRQKLVELGTNGYLKKKKVKKTKKDVTKKALQLELKSLALSLGRLPTEDDVARLSRYELKHFKEVFPTWGKALKAAKLEVGSG
jgi:site-specific DNA-methyltransferase (adenine-specific)